MSASPVHIYHSSCTLKLYERNLSISSISCQKQTEKEDFYQIQYHVLQKLIVFSGFFDKTF